MNIPKLIQGGMGAGVSAWQLARAVSETGQLGVVAGTALDVILARRLQLGDEGGHMRAALEPFPVPGVADRILERYFRPDGLDEGEGFRPMPLMTTPLSPEREELIVAANFVEVWLARQGHANAVGINYLEKIQQPTLPSLFGAMLAGVDVVLMGAGIPRAIPGLLDSLARGEAVELRLDVAGATEGSHHAAHFDPRAFCGGTPPALKRPAFYGIVSSATVASVLVRKSKSAVDGLVIENHSAGGHNAPPRGPLQVDEAGEPIYSTRDEADLRAIADLGVPFWLAGSFATHEHFVQALASGASGVQVGTAFAFCRESGLTPELKRRVLELSRTGDAETFTDPVASPTGFPFKVVQLEGTLSESKWYEARPRLCDLGYLRHAYEGPGGELRWRCPGEPETSYLKKGGKAAETEGRKCVCNGLLANIGLAQVQRNGSTERALLTAGDDVATVARFLAPGAQSYSARDVVEHMLSGRIPSEMAGV